MKQFHIQCIQEIPPTEQVIIAFKNIHTIPESLLHQPERDILNKYHETHQNEYVFELYGLNRQIIFCHMATDTSISDADYFEKLRILGHKSFKNIKDNSNGNIFIHLTDCTETEAYAFLEGFLLSTYMFDKYKSQKKTQISELFISATENISDNFLQRLQIIVQHVFQVRDWVNEPASILTPAEFVKQVQSLVKPVQQIRFTTLSNRQIQSLRMSGLLSISKGTNIPPQFLIIDYNPSYAKYIKPFVLIGKGIFFDTGGINLKPSSSIIDMKCDMAGAAVVASVIRAAALLNIPLRIVGLIPATENRPGPNASLPGDVITMMNGKTVEIVNTDAEGRLILADALCYASKYEPELVLTIATLTGSAHATFGPHASAGFCLNAENYFDLLFKTSLDIQEKIWQLPLWNEYDKMIESDVADIKNSGGKYAGAITAARFLTHFTNFPFIHLDIAGPAFFEKPLNYIPAGGTGIGVRLLLEFFNRIIQQNFFQKD